MGVEFLSAFGFHVPDHERRHEQRQGGAKKAEDDTAGEQQRRHACQCDGARRQADRQPGIEIDQQLIAQHMVVGSHLAIEPAPRWAITVAHEHVRG